MTPISEVFGVVYLIDAVIVNLMIFLVYYFAKRVTYADSSIVSLMWLFLFFFLTSLSMGFILYGHSAAGMSRYYGGMAPMFFVVLYGFRQRHELPINKILQAIVYIGLFAFLLSSIGYVKILLSHNSSPHRAFGNTNSLLIAYALITLLFARLSNIRISAFLYRYSRILIAVLFLGLVISAIRSVWVSISLTFVLFLPILSFRQSIKLYATIIILGIVLYLVISQNNYGYGNNIVEDISSRYYGIVDAQSERSASFRLISWEYHIDRFLNNPVFGEGIGNRPFYFVKDQYVDTEAHNMYIMILVQRGVAGLFPLLMIFSIVYLKLLKIKKIAIITGSEYLLSLISSFAIIMTCGWLFFTADNSLIWIFLGIYVGIKNQILDNHESLSVSSGTRYTN